MSSLSKCRRTPLGQSYADVSLNDALVWRGDGKGRGRLISSDPVGGEIALFDLTANDRFGLKGKGSSDWLKSKGLQLPEQINTMVSTENGIDLVRLGTEDFLVLSRSGLGAGTLQALRKDWKADTRLPKGFDAWREEVWAWFHLTGEHVSAFLAKTCPVDLDGTRFQKMSVAQTRAAQIDCIIVRSDRVAIPGYDLFFDIASSSYVLKSLKELAVQ